MTAIKWHQSMHGWCRQGRRLCGWCRKQTTHRIGYDHWNGSIKQCAECGAIAKGVRSRNDIVIDGDGQPLPTPGPGATVRL